MSKRKSGSSKTKKKGPSKNSREKDKEEAELVEEAEEEDTSILRIIKEGVPDSTLKESIVTLAIKLLVGTMITSARSTAKDQSLHYGWTSKSGTATKIKIKIRKEFQKAW